MKLNEIRPNPKNPRVLRDDKFQKLKKSIEDFPKMMELRPIVVDDEGVILGGNMRFRALQDIYGKNGEIPDEWVKRAADLTEDEKRQFVIKDNAAFGQWDWDVLANEWDADELAEWGIDVPLIETKGSMNTEDLQPKPFTQEVVLLLFDPNEHGKVMEVLQKIEDIAEIKSQMI